MRDDYYIDDGDDDDAELDEVLAKAETAKALLCDIEGQEIWIPKSLIDRDSEVKAAGDDGTLIIPLWFARKVGLE